MAAHFALLLVVFASAVDFRGDASSDVCNVSIVVDWDGGTPAAGSFLGEFARPGIWSSYSFHAAEWDFNSELLSMYFEPAAGSFLGEFARPGMQDRRCLWVQSITQVGLRLFWHQRGRNAFFLAFAIISCCLLEFCLSIDVLKIVRITLASLLCFLGMLHAILSTGTELFTTFSAVTCFQASLSLGRNSHISRYIRAFLYLGAYFAVAITCGILCGLLVPQFVSSVFLWLQMGFDSTLGFPGEGPHCQVCLWDELRCSCNRRGAAVARAGPYDVLNDLPDSIRVHNTFIHAGQSSESSRSRSLRPNLTDGDLPAPSNPQPLTEQHASDDGTAVSGAAGGITDGLRDVSLDPGTHSSSAASSRVYCPVRGCPESLPERAAGWRSHSSMRAHLNEHAAGRCVGAVPETYLQANRLNQCQVCSKLISTRFGGTCPSCRPQLASSSARGSNVDDSRAYTGPAFEEIFSKRVPTKNSVPKPARKLWTQCLVEALAQIVEFNDELAWAQFFMLPKAVLRSSFRGGKKRNNKKTAGAETKLLCSRWLEGQREVLWRQGRAPKRSNKKRESDQLTDEAMDRIQELVAQGQLQKACNVLTQKPPSTVTRDVIREMKDKHPEPRAPTDWSALRQVHRAAAVTVEELLTQRMIASFARGSAGGPTGLKPQHLKDALLSGSGLQDEFLRLLTQVINNLSQGEAPQNVRAFLSGASLTAIPKDTGGHRPIAVGETLRRLVSKCMLATVADDAKSRLEPLQVGVGTRLGTEATVHVARQWMCRHSGDAHRVLVKMDLENAFNCVDRQAVLSAVREMFPELAPWVDFTYGDSAGLWMDGARLESKRGIQQGDPLGPLLFSLALQIALENVRARAEVQNIGRLDYMVFYLDDGVLAGPDESVFWYCKEIQKELQDIGLSINWGPGKSEAVLAAGEDSTVDQSSFPELQFNRSGNFTILKTPIGTLDFCERYVQKRRAAAQLLLERLPELEDPQIALVLLRHCMAFCKMSYNARVVPADLQSKTLQDFDRDVRAAFSAAVGVRPDDAAWKRACRKIALGGLGLRSTSEFADAAFVSSLAACAELAASIDTAFQASDTATSDHVAKAVERLNRKLPGDAQLDSSLEDAPTQKTLTTKIERKALDMDLLSLDTSTSLKAHLQLVSLPNSGAWLHAFPCRAAKTLIDAPLFRIAIKRRLRIPILQEPTFCPACGAGMDIYADHALVCMCKGDRTIRHNALRNTANHFAKAASLHPVKEKPGLLPPRPDADTIRERTTTRGRRPADIWLPGWMEDGPAALDFAVTSGLRADVLHASALDGGHSTEAYEDVKRLYLDTAAQCSAQGLQFVPLVVEAHGGGWGPSAVTLWKKLAKEYASASGIHNSVACSEIAQRLSTTLQRECARAISRRLSSDVVEEESCNAAAWMAEDFEG